MSRYPNRNLVRDLPTTQLFLDRFFSTGVYFDAVSDTNQKRFLLANPPDSEVVLVVIDPIVRADGKMRIDKTKNVTIDTAGDAPPTGITSKSSDTVSSLGIVQLGGDGETGVFSGGTAFSPKTEGSGQGGASASPGGAGESGATNLIYPGDNLVLSATADGGARTISIDMDFIEYPSKNVP